MNIFTQCFSHLRSTNISNSVKSQAVVYLVVLIQVLSDRVDDQAKKVGVLVHQQCHCKISLVMVAYKKPGPLS